MGRGGYTEEEEGEMMPIGRQAGKAASGAVFRGSTRQLSALPRPTAAIPSKFETVINVGAKEKDGFGARSYRFKTMENDIPGPGLYHHTPDHNWGARGNEAKGMSIGTKGYGGMRTQEKRFFKPKRAAPAPPVGTYDVPRYHGELSRKDFNAAPTSAVLSRRIATGGEKLEKARAVLYPSIGPGHYGVPSVEMRKTARITGNRSAFTSGLDRFNDKQSAMNASGKADGPAPGAYETQRSTLNPERGTVAGFRDRSIRGKDVAGGPPSKAATFGAPAVIYGEEAMAAPSDPGPGTHHSTYHDMENRFKHAPKVYSAFAKVSTDRFGRPEQPKTRPTVVPGPGQYDVPRWSGIPEDGRSLLGASSAFVSASAKLQSSAASAMGLSRPPGPAYYKDADPVRFYEKKSFNLNARQKFI